MKIFRNIDWICQLVIAGISFAALAINAGYTMYGEFILGSWQILSALVNTWSMHGSTFRKRIVIYWVLAIASLLMLVSGVEVLMMISLIGSWGIAIYYCVIYKQFINHLAYREELSTVVR